MQRIKISYSVRPDGKYGVPSILNPPETQNPIMGEEFALAEPLMTDSILGTDPQTDEIYIGRWIFSGWTVPDYVTTREVEADPDILFVEEHPELITEAETGAESNPEVLPDEEYTALMTETGTEEEPELLPVEEYSALIREPETKVICTSFFDAEITGCWEFIAEEKLKVPDKIETGDDLPLSGAYDSLAKFWPERETQLNKVYATGLFPESLIRYMDENIREIPLQSSDFASVALSEVERTNFLSSVRDAYYALISETENTLAVKTGMDSLMVSAESDNAGIDTAFVVYCGEKAGLLEGKSKSMVKTADICLLYDFLKNKACADFITTDDLLQIYAAEDGEVSPGMTFNNTSVDFAHEENWYDVSSRKNTVQPGDLIFFKDELENPVTVGIIDSVEGRSITYVLCVSNGTPEEFTLYEDDIRILRQMKTKAEIIGLRSCDTSRIIYEFFVNQLKLPESSAIGIMGNLYYESKFSTTALGDKNTSFGLCQWHNDRFLNLVIFCMKNNYNIASLEGQLRFLAHELNGNYSGLLNELYQSGISASWAKATAYRFCKVFEQPADFEMNAALRGTMASGTIWDSYSELFLSQAQLQNMKMTEAAAQPVAEQQSDYIFYTVKKGDTLASICRNFGFDYANYRREVIALNNIIDENMIVEGQTLVFWRTMIKNDQD